MRWKTSWIACCMVVCALNVCAQEWERIPLLSPSSVLYGVCALDDHSLVAVGEFGTIVRSENQGETWIPVASPTTNRLRRVRFADENVGWAVGHGSTLLRTMDGGITWTEGNGQVVTDFRDIWPGDGTHAIIVGENGAILRTEDSGDTWQIIESGNNRTDDLLSVDFADPLHGCAVGGYGSSSPPRILTTSDGGLTWDEQSSDANLWLTAVAYVDDTTIVAGGLNSTILRSTDGGVTWDSITTLTEGSSIREFKFLNESYGVAASLLGQIFATDDGGLSWEYLSSLEWAQDIDLLPSGIVFTAGNVGVYVSTDSGQVWNETGRMLTGSAVEVEFIDNLHGWILSDRQLFYTENGGITWQWHDLPAPWNVKSMCMIAPGVGILSLEEYIYRTVDNGATWDEWHMYVTSDPIMDIDFADAAHGWAVGYENAIIHTNDSGLTWQSQEPGSGGVNTAVFALDSMHAWIPGMKTEDGGQHWSWISGFPVGVNDILFFDMLNGIVVGYNGLIGRTTDGGLTWDTRELQSRFYYSTAFANSDEGWVVGRDGVILHTENGGDTWESAESITSNTLFDVAISGNVVWVVGNNATVLRGEISTSVSHSPMGIASDFALSLYPNPFNSTATLQFELPRETRVEIVLYDVLGRMALNLADDIYTSGAHTLKVDAGSLASGVYFANLRTPEFSTTQKLLLLR